jgi:hypothetical protein
MNNDTEYVSKDIIRFLKDKYDWNLAKIAEVIGCSEFYVERVKGGSRSFTFDHLMMLEKELGEPVAILLLKSLDPEKIDEELRPSYNQFMLRVNGKEE